MHPRAIPDRREFEQLDQRFQDEERFLIQNLIQNAGHHRAGRSRINWRLEDRVIALARSYPLMSLRRIAGCIGNISHMTVRRIIREQGFRPYRLQYVQALQPGDYRARREFCQWMLQKLENNSHFIENILFTDEASFSNISILNRHNTRIWAPRNLHAIIQREMQSRFAINVWMGVIGKNFVGPIYLPLCLTGFRYLDFLQNQLLRNLHEIIPRHRRNRVYFMHDGTQPHFDRRVRVYLHNLFGTRWIRRRPHVWPLCSPDLNSLDFFFVRSTKGKCLPNW